MLGISYFIGMSYFVKKPELDKLNGLSWFGNFLAEDFFIAKYLNEKGFRHMVAAVPAQQNVIAMSIAAYKVRMVRWLRLRMNMMPLTAVILELLGELIPLEVYASWSMHHFFGINAYMLFCIHWAIWFSFEYFQLNSTQNSLLPFSRFMFVIAWLIHDLLYIFVFFEACINPCRIKSGKRTYRLSNFGEQLDIISDKAILPI